MNPVRRILEIKAKYPHHVTVKDYMVRMRSGLMPRPDAMPPEFDREVGSWVENRRRGSRTFGFRSAEVAAAFRARYGLTPG